MKNLPIYRRGGQWHIRATVAGQRVRRSLETTERSVAAEKARLILLGLDPSSKIVGVSGPSRKSNIVPVAQRIGMTLKQAFDREWSDNWNARKDQYNVRLRVDHILSVLGGDLLLSDLTDEHIALLRESWQSTDAEGGRSKPVSAATMNRNFSPLSTVLHRARDKWRTIDSFPYIPRMKEESESKRDALTHDEFDAVLDPDRTKSPHRFHTLWMFLLGTGCRRGEAQKLEWRHVDFRQQTVRFLGTKHGQRVVPLTLIPRLVEELAILKSTGIEKPFDLTDTQIHWQWLRLKRELKLPEGHVLHMLRHTCASRLLSTGMHVRDLQAWMGHTTLEQTQRYTHLTNTALQDHAAVVSASFMDATLNRPVPKSRKDG